MNYYAHQMGHVVIETPDLKQSREEAVTLLGLHVSERNDNFVSLTSNDRSKELTYIASDRAAVRSIGLEVADEKTLQDAVDGCKLLGLDAKADFSQYDSTVKSLIVQGPSGISYELHTPFPRSQPGAYVSTGVQPFRLDHVNLTVPNPKEEFAFLRSAFGLGLSDRSDGDEIYFLHAADGYHHSIALVKGEPGLHHVSFEAKHVGDLIRLADRLANENRVLLWGPGHHGANAQSYFTYHLDPIGCMIEYSFGMKRIDSLNSFTPGIWPMNPKGPSEEWLNLWGAPPPGMYGEPRLPVSNAHTRSLQFQ